MTRIVNVSDLVEANGNTIRENNLALNHSIPIGTIVRSKYLGQFGIVTRHTRDCDGTPLYVVSVESALSEDDLVPLSDDLSQKNPRK